jgi:hypothetical protein
MGHMFNLFNIENHPYHRLLSHPTTLQRGVIGPLCEACNSSLYWDLRVNLFDFGPQISYF